MKIMIKVLFIVLSTTWVSCTIAGLSYMDPLNFGKYKAPTAGEDPCNPLYWYPKHIPEYCYHRNLLKPGAAPPPIPLPIPVPVPQPYPFPPPIPPLAPPPLMPLAPPIALPMPLPLMPPQPLPFGIPLAPTNPMIPVAGVPFPGGYGVSGPYPGGYGGSFPFQQQLGMVPGIPGLVTQDGGINILPFSDAYSDLLEKHKQKMIRKKLQKVLDDYQDYPKRRYRKHRRRMRF